MSERQILDAACGSRMFWFDKNRDDVIYADIRDEVHELCDGRSLEITPDIKADFRNMPFEDESFRLVIFDPPHLKKLGKSSWMAKKYGRLFPSWRDDIKQGFKECFRVLEPGGILVFKWNEIQILVSEILELCEHRPLIGHKSGKRSNTHWMLFMKPNPHTDE